MSILPEAAKAFIGMTTERQLAPDAVEPGAVRRFSQAIMDDDPAYWQTGEASARSGGPVAPPLYPTTMFRRAFGTPDPFAEQADNPDFDGAGNSAMAGLPEITPLRGFNVLNGGSEVEFYRYARWGEQVMVRSTYEDILEKQTSKGPIILIIIVSEFSTGEGEVLLKLRRTSIRRPI
jgi:hypothetical protein